MQYDALREAGGGAADAEARRTDRTLGWVCRKALERYLASAPAAVRLDEGGVAG